MKNSVVNIESVSNNAFGTGFVIDSDEKGVYILTCQHVLDDVETPVVENVLAKVIARGEFIDMAIIYVSKLHLKALPLQTETTKNLEVEVIGFSTFNKTLTQKKHIKATLYEEAIELHSKEDDSFYTVRKIRANDGFNFDRGNSGSPVICKSSGNVIAMVSNKEGSDLAYAIDIENLKTVWKDVPSKLFETSTLIDKETNESNIIGDDITPLPTPPSNGSVPFLKYALFLLLVMSLGFGAYKVLHKLVPPTTKKSEIRDIVALEEMGFKALVEKDYRRASILFNQAYKLNSKYHNLYEINRLLKKYEYRMHEPIIKNMVLRKITKDLSWGAPKEAIAELRKQIRN
jgi:hypothetical protein